ncbi:hypothetical protein ACFOSD_03470 [Salinispirillum marinum]|uniref:Tetratricopeptide repeat protein n=2 Tax=Saccharospirillaceae TaxID=255527 RepID=A0ABV8BDH3_9GAMM
MSALMQRLFQRTGRLAEQDVWTSSSPVQSVAGSGLHRALWVLNAVAAGLLVWQGAVWWLLQTSVVEPSSKIIEGVVVDLPALDDTPIRVLAMPDLSPLHGGLRADTADSEPMAEPEQPVTTAPVLETAPIQAASTQEASQQAPSAESASPSIEQPAASNTPQVATARVAEPVADGATQWTELATDDVILGIRRAEGLHRSGDEATAYFILRQLNTNAPNDLDVRQAYARLLIQDEDFNTATDLLAAPQSVDELELLAFGYYQQGQFAQAVQAYRGLLAESTVPKPEWVLWLAIALEQVRQPTQAREHYQQYLGAAAGQPASLVQFAQERMRVLAP